MFVLLNCVYAIFYVLVTFRRTPLALPGEPSGHQPDVAVIIPICSEPAFLLRQTIQSVLDQNYPIRNIKLFVANDAMRLGKKFKGGFRISSMSKPETATTGRAIRHFCGIAPLI